MLPIFSEFREFRAIMIEQEAKYLEGHNSKKPYFIYMVKFYC